MDEVHTYRIKDEGGWRAIQWAVNYKREDEIHKSDGFCEYYLDRYDWEKWHHIIKYERPHLMRTIWCSALAIGVLIILVLIVL